MFTINVNESDLAMLEQDLTAELEKHRVPVQMAMTYRLYDIIMNNFGEAGEDRPFDWIALTPAYAKKVGRPHATLEVSGRLRYSIQVDGALPEGGRVWVTDADVPYATVHQWGGGNNIPARPYFPVDAAGNVTEYTTNEVIEAGRQEMERLL